MDAIEASKLRSTVLVFANADGGNGVAVSSGASPSATAGVPGLKSDEKARWAKNDQTRRSSEHEPWQPVLDS